MFELWSTMAHTAKLGLRPVDLEDFLSMPSKCCQLQKVTLRPLKSRPAWLRFLLRVLLRWFTTQQTFDWFCFWYSFLSKNVVTWWMSYWLRRLRELCLWEFYPVQWTCFRNSAGFVLSLITACEPGWHPFDLTEAMDRACTTRVWQVEWPMASRK